jgi:hypothetical protein
MTLTLERLLARFIVKTSARVVMAWMSWAIMSAELAGSVGRAPHVGLMAGWLIRKYQ